MVHGLAMDLDGASSPMRAGEGASRAPVTETPEARWQRLERHAARTASGEPMGSVPSPIAAYG